ncbi:MAG: hypothetical protein F6K35_42110 [Okeania sp. SIO2H7]|nr:hypothetical protein [Okeania sp. SIO2H7]
MGPFIATASVACVRCAVKPSDITGAALRIVWEKRSPLNVRKKFRSRLRLCGCERRSLLNGDHVGAFFQPAAIASPKYPFISFTQKRRRPS